MTESRPGADTPPPGAPAEPLTGQFTAQGADPAEKMIRFLRQAERINPFADRPRKPGAVVEVRFTMEFADLRLTFAADHPWPDDAPRLRDVHVWDQRQERPGAKVLTGGLVKHVLEEISRRDEETAG
jgi:hypothetical protein